jgi:hypothetical protein
VSELIWKLIAIAALPAAVTACNPAADLRTAVAAEPFAGAAAIHVDACSLVTRDEAESILGAVMGDPSRYADQSRSICTFVVAEGDTTIRLDYPSGTRRARRRAVDDESAASPPSGTPHFVSASGYLLSVESPSPATATALAVKAAARVP